MYKSLRQVDNYFLNILKSLYLAKNRLDDDSLGFLFTLVWPDKQK